VLTVYIEHATPMFLLPELDSTALRLLTIPEFQEY
jgi:hypothetical protein